MKDKQKQKNTLALGQRSKSGKYLALANPDIS